MKKKIIITIGTRPEAIKMAPLIIELKKRKWAEVYVLATAQHRELLDSVLSTFNIKPDFDLNVMSNNQTLNKLTVNLLDKLDPILEKIKPDVVLAQGDTTTVLTTCLASFYKSIDFGHVEAGLRTGDLKFPFPEEANRVLVSRLSRWNFAPTESAKKNLLGEGINDSSIYVTGNTVIDSLQIMKGKNSQTPKQKLNNKNKHILVTIHRRENFGEPLMQICQAIKKLIKNNINLSFTIPMHPNPNVKRIIEDQFRGNPKVNLIEATKYQDFIELMKNSFLILSDSGGVQEEAPALGTPVLVLRNETERPEAIQAGSVKLVGTSCSGIFQEVNNLMADDTYLRMSRSVSPYGDGKASIYISDILEDSLNVSDDAIK